MEASKRPRRGKAWPNVSLFGPGGDDGAELLRELAGDPDTLEALFACTMGLNAEAILGMLGVRRDVFAVIACHHPERCWQGDPAERRHPRARQRERDGERGSERGSRDSRGRREGGEAVRGRHNDGTSSTTDEPAVDGYTNVRLVFPPFCDAPERREVFAQRHKHQARQPSLTLTLALTPTLTLSVTLTLNPHPHPHPNGTSARRCAGSSAASTRSCSSSSARTACALSWRPPT